MSDFSHISNAHPSYIESMYQQYSDDPNSIDASWREFFLGFDYGHSNGNGAVAEVSVPIKAVDAQPDFEQIAKELRVLALIKAYRIRGHMDANIDPVGQFEDPDAKLDLSDYGLTEADLQTIFYCAKELFLPPSTLEDIIKHLQRVYCSSIGFEYHFISDRAKRRWLRERIEKSQPETAFGMSLDRKRQILTKLNGAVGFEAFLKKKYVAQKRFGLEGGESAIVGLDTIISEAANKGAEEIVIGMAHRGRLNVLVNIMGKTYDSVFNEFEGAVPEEIQGGGDVKYHLGYSSIVPAGEGHEVNLKLVPNPSHLEAVGPVVEGFARAKADMLYNNDYDKILPILIHGDAAVAGQGVVFETIQMSELDGYTTGGTLHFIINNQIGFTTDYNDARSSLYATGVAGVVDAPVFHVNGDDPEAVAYACELALAYRQEFNSDVFIDMLCYRKHGHNEGDDPAYTQPGMYDRIRNHDDPRKVYTEKLIQRGDLERKLAEEMQQQFNDMLQERYDDVKTNKPEYRLQEPEKAWIELYRDARSAADFAQSPETGISEDNLQHIFDHLTYLPASFKPINKVGRLFKNFDKMRENDAFDWATGELAAYAAILKDGHDVRMSGQDVRRGTFSHRHAILNGKDGESKYNRLEGLAEQQGEMRIYNSLLSEFAVLGFEYGYAMSSPQNMVVWEAQFGDFANGASTIFDQFISAGESKWRRMNGMTILLPHGYEGQGPEHSSARPERFLHLCAEYNMVVANTTLPANFFHLLRRQMAWNFRIPLVHMSPKSLLRHPMAVSKAADFLSGTRFQEILDDPTVSPRGNKKIKRLLLCTGKVYYDLAKYKADRKQDDVAIVRLEQLYPLPYGQLQKLMKRYANAEVIWVQEEPRNFGYWHYISEQFLYNEELALDLKLSYVGRPAAASPATGFKYVHEREQKELVEGAFA
ncbi:MAG: 2-oxoglutarate dehydrogenase E1 component [Bacteroidota bacterium]